MSSDDQSVASDASEDSHANHGLASDEEPGIDDLFGDDDEEEKPRRRLDDDDDLDSGDDEGRNDRRKSPAWDATPPPDTEDQEDLQVMPLNVPRHVIPEPSDNEVSPSPSGFYLAFAQFLASSTSSKFLVSSPLSPRFGISTPLDHRQPSIIQKRHPLLPSLPTILPSQPCAGVSRPPTRMSCNQMLGFCAGQMVL